jgi:hypothetical protein
VVAAEEKLGLAVEAEEKLAAFEAYHRIPCAATFASAYNLGDRMLRPLALRLAFVMDHLAYQRTFDSADPVGREDFAAQEVVPLPFHDVLPSHLS